MARRAAAMAMLALWSTASATKAWRTRLAWNHNFETAGSMYWGDFGYSMLSPAQAKFIAKNYAVVSLEKCTGNSSNLPTEEGIYRTAAQLKAINPKVKVLFYWSTSQAGIECYKSKAEFMAHPEWWLRDDLGQVIRVGSGTPVMDVTNADAVAWWLSVPLSGPNASKLIDGILADDAGYNNYPNISTAREQALEKAKMQMLLTMQERFDVINRGVVMGNGLSEYDLNPVDPHNRLIVGTMRGVMNEHFAAFEQVDPKTGKLIKSKAADALAEIEWAARNETKQVFCSFWAGPYVGFGADGRPAFAKADPYNKAPTGTQAQVHEGWRAQLRKYLPFNLAAFLTVAGPNTWFMHAVWYGLDQGFLPCPDAPDTCEGPWPWYPELSKPLGPPKGPRVQLSQYRWRREFARATVTLDLDDPLGGSGIVFGEERVSYFRGKDAEVVDS